MKFRKKPVVIEAWHLHGPGDANASVLPSWLAEAVVKGAVQVIAGDGLVIHTLEGEMRADVGDWIIQGVKQEIYPCKPDIFAATYEAVE